MKKTGQLFPVPHKNSSVFNKWIRIVSLSGYPGHRICGDHFKPDDFLIVKRVKLKPASVPSILPNREDKFSLKPGCCVKGCKSRKRQLLQKFPPARSSRRKLWNLALGLPKGERRSLKICHLHFKTSDFVQTTRRYLKPNSVPSRGINSIKSRKLVIYTKEDSDESDNEERAVPEHGYCLPLNLPCSRTICFVSNCTARAGNGIKLHKFPLEDQAFLKKWTAAIKTRKKPSKYSRVCSRHFKNDDYLPGGKRLKPQATPSQHLPLIDLLKLPNPYKRKFTLRERNLSPPRNPHSSHVVEQHSPSPTSPSANDENGCMFGEVSYVDTDTSRYVTNELSEVMECEFDPAEINHNSTFANPANPCIKQCDAERTTHEKSRTDNVEQNFGNGSENPDGVLNRLIKELKGNSTVNNTSTSSLNHEKAFTLTSLIKTDKDAIVWTGLTSLGQLDAICISVKIIEDQLYKEQHKMSAIDRVILTLAKLKQNISFAAIATLFGVSSATVAQYFNHTIQVLAEVLQQFVYWPDRDEIAKNIPLCFRGKYENVRCVLDCTEIPVATMKCINCCIACYSSYKGMRTVKFLIGITPAGLINFVSKAYSGKASDKQIFNDENVLGLLEPFKDELMVDKGFNIQQECLNYGVRLHIPPFLRSAQHTAKDAVLNESIAKSRIHVERAIQRIKLFGIFQDAIDASVLGLIDYIMKVVCAIVNLSAPILKDKRF